MRNTLASRLLSLLLGCLAFGAGALAQEREEARMLLATQTLEEIAAMPDQNVPDWLLARAHGVAVIPGVVKIGLGLGGRGGKGVLVVRNEQGGWTNPVFIRLAGGSFGWQAGVQQADVILVFTSQDGIEGITDGKLTLGADASVAAGPVGRSTSAATDPNFQAEVYSYSRTRGLFAGLALDAAAITIDRKANAAFYGVRDVTPTEIFASTAPEPPPAARRFVDQLNTATRTASGPPAGAAPSETVTPAQQPPVTEGTGTQTFPMEDPNPGQEPPPG
ncbi:MAG TPA: lipid-binding SYLF domain-containing protein [Steroidobacteraceae bacterium]|nr:lipid-binding SYLF domain-containing protein [Steroidobacteraceae bacterium]